MFSLTIQSGDVERELVFEKDLVQIGRHAENDVMLEDDAVSRRHAIIERREGVFLIRDLNSRNGVSVNNIPVGEAELENEDFILLGNSRLVFRRRPGRNAAEAPAPVPPPPGGYESRPTETTGIAGRSPGDAASTRELERRLEIIANLNKIVFQAAEPRQLLERILTFIEKNFIFDRAAILLAREGIERMEIAASRLRAGETEELVISQSAIEAARKPEGLLARNVQRDPRFASSESVRLQGIRSILATPLTVEQKALGVIYLDISVSRHIYGQDDLQFLLALGREVGLALENFRLKEASRQAEKMATVGRTISSVSQSIKNVLLLTKSSMTMVDMALAQEDLPRIRSAWEVMQHNQDKINRVIEDMLFYSQGRPRQFDRVDVNRLIQDTVEAMIDRMREDGVSLQWELDPRMDPVWTDAAAVTRSFQNLMLSAWEAAQGQPGAWIRVESRLEDDGRLAIAVSDNGPSIHPDRMEDVFEPFQNPRSAGAAGLSLALARRLMVDLEGELTVEAGTPRGAVFVIRLPRHHTRPDDMTLDPALMSKARLGN